MEKKVTLLYVDDEEINLQLFALSFEPIYSIITAISGQEGLLKLEDHKDDIIVVISDMKMPQMDGIEFINEARKKHDNIAYFILTGFEFNDKIDEALKTNTIQEFFTKPFNIEEIKNAVQKVVNQIGNDS